MPTIKKPLAPKGGRKPSRTARTISTADLLGNRQFRLAKRTLMGDDAKRRIVLGALSSQQVEGYDIYTDDNGYIVLAPLSTIPADERWIYDNPARIQSLREGLQQAAEGRFGEWPSFASELDSD